MLTTYLEIYKIFDTDEYPMGCGQEDLSIANMKICTRYSGVFKNSRRCNHYLSPKESSGTDFSC